MTIKSVVPPGSASLDPVALCDMGMRVITLAGIFLRLIESEFKLHYVVVHPVWSDGDILFSDNPEATLLIELYRLIEAVDIYVEPAFAKIDDSGLDLV